LNNLKVTVEILTLFLLRRYERVFGLTFAVMNSAFFFIAIFYYKKNRHYFHWSFALYMLAQLLENALFFMLGVYCFHSDTLILNDNFVNGMVITMISWIILSVIVCII
jgi:uncharacterized membrane-anchored protein YitT (DUF2179 family)